MWYSLLPQANNYVHTYNVHYAANIICCYVYVIVLFIILLNCLQVIGVASTQPSSTTLHENTGAYDVPNVTADKQQKVRKCFYHSATCFLDHFYAAVSMFFVCMCVYTPRP